MGTKVAAFVAVMGTAAIGCAPAQAQVGDAGRASGSVYGRSDGNCRDWNRPHEWDGRGGRRDDCDEWRGDSRYDRRDERWDRRRDDRIANRIEARYRNDRAHRALVQRLDRAHREWHRRHGWTVRGRREAREHEELHWRLERLHDDWHRHDRRGRIRER